MKPSFELAASILSANFAQLGDDVTMALKAGADRIHFDVMDHHFVPHLTIGPLVCKALRRNGITAPIDVHLMTLRPSDLVDDFVEAGATQITFHVEAVTPATLLDTVKKIRQQGCEAGVALNPETPHDAILPYLQAIDHVLVMSVHPGRGGQAFIPHSLEKIRVIKACCTRQALNTKIAVDGGINTSNVAAVVQAGADGLVTGSALFKAPDYKTFIRAMREMY